MKRKSNFELLRILAMFMIICSHYCGHNGLDISVPSFGWLKLFFCWGILGNLGVDLFFMLSGYFLCTKEEPFSGKKAFRLWAEVFFYSMAIYLALVAGGVTEFSVKGLILALFPTLLMQYSYFTVYLAIYILSPWLVKINRGGVQLKPLLLVMLLLFSVIPTLLPSVFIDSYLTDGILLFYVGVFLREYREELWNRFSSLALLGAAAGIWLCAGAMTVLLSEKISLYSYIFLYERNSPVTILVAVLLFVAFGQWKMGAYPIVNTVAGHVFGVFLIHDNLAFSPVMWHTWFDNQRLWGSGLIVLHMLFSCVVVFAVGILIDIVREKVVEGLLMDRVMKWKPGNG